MDERKQEQNIVRVLKALADKSRFRMVQEIAAAGELSCGAVGKRFHLAQPTISHHLKILSDAGVVLVRREGQHGMLSVNPELGDLLGMIPARLKSPRRRASSPRAGRERRPG